MDMKEQIPRPTSIPVSARIDAALREELGCAAELRGHTLSEAIEYMIREFLPVYKDQVAPKFERVA